MIAKGEKKKKKMHNYLYIKNMWDLKYTYSFFL
jgi:hypothetical protein